MNYHLQRKLMWLRLYDLISMQRPTCFSIFSVSLIFHLDISCSFFCAMHCIILHSLIYLLTYLLTNVCRLWGEIFQLADYNGKGGGYSGDDGKWSWMRLSDGVAPINVTCSSSSSSLRHDDDDGRSTTVFHVAAYSRHVEKILDVTICQPGASCRSPVLVVLQNNQTRITPLVEMIRPTASSRLLLPRP